ncbi:MAG: acyl carrier protein [Bacteroidales bacterium]|nr:acyl carrier protein [Bacteroidales bacterium]
MTLQDIQDKVKAFLVDELEIDEEKIMDEASLRDDLAIDSLEVVDIIVFVEREFGFKMKPEDFRAIKTYDQFCQFIREKLG